MSAGGSRDSTAACLQNKRQQRSKESVEALEQLHEQTFRSSPERGNESARERRESDGERVNERERTYESEDILQHGTVREDIAPAARDECGCCCRSPYTKRAKASMATIADQIEMENVWGDLRDVQLSQGGRPPCNTSRPHTIAHTNIGTQTRTLSTTHIQQGKDGKTEVTVGSGTVAGVGPHRQQQLNLSPARLAEGEGRPASTEDGEGVGSICNAVCTK